MTTTRVPGRPRSIPTEHFDTVLKLYAAGEGYRRIAKQLASITTTDYQIIWLTVLVQLRISDHGKTAAALCQVQFPCRNHLVI